MRRILLSLLVLIAVPVLVSGQQNVCRQDTISLYIQNHRGDVYWQTSIHGTDWSRVDGATGDTLVIIATQPGFFRTEVIEGQCAPAYSDIIHLMVNDPPVVTFDPRDSVCQNEAAFVLTGGSPEGGTFWGPGVTDGKFNPSLAGTGLHKIYYRYFDSQTTCSDTAFAFIRVFGLPNRAQAGDDQPFIAADSIRLIGNVPENGNGMWSVVSGTGGRFSDPADPDSWFIKDSSNLVFTLRWSITGRCGSTFDDVSLTFFQVSKNPCPDAPYVTDADGNIYPTVQIGGQCWMAKNLNVGRYVASTVSNIDHSNLSNNGIVEKYCYNNDINNCTLYGGLYDWDEAMGYSDTEGAQGICPEGWHMPSDNDWKALNSYYIYGNAGAYLKIGGSSGFDAYFAGDRHARGEFYGFAASGFFWQSSSYIYLYINDGYIREVAACNGALVKNHFNKKTGISVRCIKDN
ncbi:MAG: fibrobacter succinogenes major paralogous domain-containing protein [Bacteroidota bacterium]